MRFAGVDADEESWAFSRFVQMAGRSTKQREDLAGATQPKERRWLPTGCLRGHLFGPLMERTPRSNVRQASPNRVGGQVVRAHGGQRPFS